MSQESYMIPIDNGQYTIDGDLDASIGKIIYVPDGENIDNIGPYVKHEHTDDEVFDVLFITYFASLVQRNIEKLMHIGTRFEGYINNDPNRELWEAVLCFKSEGIISGLMDAYDFRYEVDRVIETSEVPDCDRDYNDEDDDGTVKMDWYKVVCVVLMKYKLSMQSNA